MSETEIRERFREGLGLVKQGVATLEQSFALMGGRESTIQPLGPAEQRVDQIAHEHEVAIRDRGVERQIEGHGLIPVITLDESLVIRQRFYPGSSSAFLFGRGYLATRANKILYRPGIPLGQQRSGDDPVTLTEVGRMRAQRHAEQMLHHQS